MIDGMEDADSYVKFRKELVYHAVSSTAETVFAFIAYSRAIKGRLLSRVKE